VKDPSAQAGDQENANPNADRAAAEALFGFRDKTKSAAQNSAPVEEPESLQVHHRTCHHPSSGIRPSDHPSAFPGPASIPTPDPRSSVSAATPPGF